MSAALLSSTPVVTKSATRACKATKTAPVAMVGMPARALAPRMPSKRTLNVRAQAAAVTETTASSLVKDPEAAEVCLGLS